MQQLISHGLWDIQGPPQGLCNFSRGFRCLWSLVVLEPDALSSHGSHLHNLLCSLQRQTENLDLSPKLFTQKTQPHQTHYSLKLWCSSAPSHSKTLPSELLSPFLAPSLGSGSSLLPLIQSHSFYYAGWFNSPSTLPQTYLCISQRLINVSIRQRATYARQNHWQRFCNLSHFLSLTLLVEESCMKIYFPHKGRLNWLQCGF